MEGDLSLHRIWGQHGVSENWISSALRAAMDDEPDGQSAIALRIKQTTNATILIHILPALRTKVMSEVMDQSVKKA